MKKLIATVAVFSAMITAAHALSFQWNANSIKFDGSSLKSNNDVTGYLVYLGNKGSYSESYALSESSTGASVAASIGTVVDSKKGTSAMSKINSTFSFDYGSYVNDDVFGVLLTYTKEGTTYYNLSSSTYTLTGITSETSSPDTANLSFSFADGGSASSVKSGGGWTAVPEPSTAALALAGLALLLKRRKA